MLTCRQCFRLYTIETKKIHVLTSPNNKYQRDGVFGYLNLKWNGKLCTPSWTP